MIQHGMPVRGPSSAGLIRPTAATPTDPGNGSGYRLPRLLAALVAGMLLLGVPAVVDVPPSSSSRHPNPGPASPRRPPRLRQPLVAVERLGALALLRGLEAPEQVFHLVLAEAREREVEVGRRLEVSQETGEEGVVPRP